MSNILDLSKTSVESVLKSAPKATRFFLDWKTACAGCGFARFCTLKNVVDVYRIDEKSFQEELAKLTNRNMK